MAIFQFNGKLEGKDLFTLANAACGVIGIWLALQGQVLAWLYVIPAVFFDWMDGKWARKSGGKGNDLGRELDSLADTVSFVVAPAIIFFIFSAGDWIELVAAGLFVLAGITRLALFNVQTEKGIFIGLPTPAAAFLVLAVNYFALFSIWPAIAFVVLAFFMVSGFRLAKPKL